MLYSGAAGRMQKSIAAALIGTLAAAGTAYPADPIRLGVSTILSGPLSLLARIEDSVRSLG